MERKGGKAGGKTWYVIYHERNDEGGWRGNVIISLFWFGERKNRRRRRT